jgi:hypothetical protein
LVKATEEALAASGKDIPLKKVKIGIRGEIKPDEARTFAHPRSQAHPHS